LSECNDVGKSSAIVRIYSGGSWQNFGVEEVEVNRKLNYGWKTANIKTSGYSLPINKSEVCTISFANSVTTLNRFDGYVNNITETKNGKDIDYTYELYGREAFIQYRLYQPQTTVLNAGSFIADMANTIGYPVTIASTLYNTTITLDSTRKDYVHNYLREMSDKHTINYYFDTGLTLHAFFGNDNTLSGSINFAYERNKVSDVSNVYNKITLYTDQRRFNDMVEDLYTDTASDVTHWTYKRYKKQTSWSNKLYDDGVRNADLSAVTVAVGTRSVHAAGETVALDIATGLFSDSGWYAAYWETGSYLICDLGDWYDFRTISAINYKVNVTNSNSIGYFPGPPYSSGTLIYGVDTEVLFSYDFPPTETPAGVAPHLTKKGGRWATNTGWHTISANVNDMIHSSDPSFVYGRYIGIHIEVEKFVNDAITNGKPLTFDVYVDDLQINTNYQLTYVDSASTLAFGLREYKPDNAGYVIARTTMEMHNKCVDIIGPKVISEESLRKLSFPGSLNIEVGSAATITFDDTGAVIYDIKEVTDRQTNGEWIQEIQVSHSPIYNPRLSFGDKLRWLDAKVRDINFNSLATSTMNLDKLYNYVDNSTSQYSNKDITYNFSCNTYTPQQVLDAIYKWNGNTWAPTGFTNITSALFFRDINTGNYIRQFPILINHGGSIPDPAIVWDQAFVNKKDVTAGGFLASNQGGLGLGHGLYYSVEKPHLWLTHATIASEWSTLDVKYWDTGAETVTATTINGTVYPATTIGWGLERYANLRSGKLIVARDYVNQAKNIEIYHDTINGSITSNFGNLVLSAPSGTVIVNGVSSMGTVPLSNVTIDVSKDWNNKNITNLGTLNLKALDDNTGGTIEILANFVPSADFTYNLGTLSHNYNNAYVSTVYLFHLTSTNNSILVDKSLIPGTTGIDIGTPGGRFNNVCLSNTLWVDDTLGTAGTASPKLWTQWVDPSFSGVCAYCGVNHVKPQNVVAGQTASAAPILICERHLGTWRDMWVHGSYFGSEGTVNLANAHGTLVAAIGHASNGNLMLYPGASGTIPSPNTVVTTKFFANTITADTLFVNTVSPASGTVTKFTQQVVVTGAFAADGGADITGKLGVTSSIVCYDKLYIDTIAPYSSTFTNFSQNVSIAGKLSVVGSLNVNTITSYTGDTINFTRLRGSTIYASTYENLPTTNISGITIDASKDWNAKNLTNINTLSCVRFDDVSGGTVGLLTDLVPVSDFTNNLGALSHNFLNAYISTLNIFHLTSTNNSILIDKTLIPASTGIDLGSSGGRFGDAYFNGTIQIFTEDGGLSGTGSPRLFSQWTDPSLSSYCPYCNLTHVRPQNTAGGASLTAGLILMSERHLGSWRDIWAHGSCFSNEGTLYLSNAHGTLASNIGCMSNGALSISPGHAGTAASTNTIILAGSTVVVLGALSASTYLNLPSGGSFSGNLTDLTINGDKDWQAKNITNMGTLNAKVLHAVGTNLTISSHVAPAADVTYDNGLAGAKWNRVYSATMITGNLWAGSILYSDGTNGTISIPGKATIGTLYANTYQNLPAGFSGNLSDLSINVAKNWGGYGITSIGTISGNAGSFSNYVYTNGLSCETLGVATNLQVDGYGKIDHIYLTNGWSNYADANNSEISNDTVTYNALMLVGNNKSGTRRVDVWDRLVIHGALYADSFENLPAAGGVSLSAVNIDTNKNWGGYGITSVGTITGVAGSFSSYVYTDGLSCETLGVATNIVAGGQITSNGTLSGIAVSNRQNTVNSWILYANNAGAKLNYNGGYDALNIDTSGNLSIGGNISSGINSRIITQATIDNAAHIYHAGKSGGYWAWYLWNTTSGSNTGDDMVLFRYADDAGFLGAGMSIRRSDGKFSTAHNVLDDGAGGATFVNAIYTTGSGGALWFANRNDNSTLYAWYANNGYAYLWSSATAGNALTCDSLGNFNVGGSLSVDGGAGFGGDIVVYHNDSVYCNVNSTNGGNAVFNVMSSSDDKIAVGWDQTNGFIEAYHGNLAINASEAGKYVDISAAGGYVFIHGGITISPSDGGGSGYCGNSTRYWYDMYCYQLHLDTQAYTFDVYDDLAIAKLWGEPNQTIDENKYDKDKVKPPVNDPFSIIRGAKVKSIHKTTGETIVTEDDNGFFNLSKWNGFLMGCVKKLAVERDNQLEINLALMNSIDVMNNQIGSLTTMLSDIQKMLDKNKGTIAM
jgi:hypothetical protein